MDNEERKRRIGEMIDSAAERSKTHGPSCAECKWGVNTEARWANISECTNPVYQLDGLGVGPNNGKKGPLLKEARSDNGLCGPQAVLFEPRSLQGFFKKIKSLFSQ